MRLMTIIEILKIQLNEYKEADILMTDDITALELTIDILSDKQIREWIK